MEVKRISTVEQNRFYEDNNLTTCGEARTNDGNMESLQQLEDKRKLMRFTRGVRMDIYVYIVILNREL